MLVPPRIPCQAKLHFYPIAQNLLLSFTLGSKRTDVRDHETKFFSFAWHSSLAMPPASTIEPMAFKLLPLAWQQQPPHRHSEWHDLSYSLKENGHMWPLALRPPLPDLKKNAPSSQTGIWLQEQQAYFCPKAVQPIPRTALLLSSSPGWTVREAPLLCEAIYLTLPSSPGWTKRAAVCPCQRTSPERPGKQPSSGNPATIPPWHETFSGCNTCQQGSNHGGSYGSTH